jgi:hypothetical protein
MSIRLRPYAALILASLLLAGPVRAQPKADAPAPDHGMVLATAMEVAPGKLKDTTKRSDTKNYVFRGRVIALDRDRRVSLCFDTDLMRVAGAWIGKPVVYTADKNMGPAVEGKMLFSTRPGPGWAKDGKWDDPRMNGEGPLPHDWAHYRGLYVNGDKVVLSYSVGDCSVLEMPSFTTYRQTQLVARTLALGPSSHPMSMLVCAAEEKGWEVVGKTWAATLAAKANDPVTVVAVVGAPPGAELRLADGRLCLDLPRLARAEVIRVHVASGKLGADLSRALDKTENIRALITGGAPRWEAVIETRGIVAPGGKSPYVVDDVTLPTDNPWHTPIRPGGLDYFPDGRAAVCTWDGDVWIVSGLDDKLDKVRWKRFASGLQQPLGLKIVDGVIYTAGRDQITKLHDLNGDGEADFYENFNNDAPLTLQRHEFVMDLQTDPQGNFYFGRSGHYVAAKNGGNCCVYKLSPDGKKLTVVARGFREPNGLSIGPDGTIIAGDNEGNGIPQSPLYRLKPGAFYGYRPSQSEALATKGATWEYAQKPIVWLPISVDRSAGSQVWVPDDRFGPLKGQLLHTSYGNCALYSVLIDRNAEPWQGAVWKWPLAFSSGVMRARFGPHDGQLYLCGLRGWGTNAVKDGQFCRVRYTGKALPMPVGFEVERGAMTVAFSGPLDRAAAEDDDNWTGSWSNPIVAQGTPTKGKQELPISKVQLSADGKTVRVGLEKVQPAANFTLQYQLKAADGAAVSGELHGTIHRVP